MITRRPMPTRNSRAFTPRAEDGATMVEAIFVLPLLIVMMLALIEFSLFFREQSSVADASRSGARAIVATSAFGLADHEGLVAMKSSLGTLAGSPEWIVVFKADDFNSEVPANCLDGSGVAGVCNVYPGDAPTWTEQEFIDSGLHADWPASDRQASAADGTDLVGVHVVYRRDFVTGLFGDGADVNWTARYRIEPKVQ